MNDFNKGIQYMTAEQFVAELQTKGYVLEHRKGQIEIACEHQHDDRTIYVRKQDGTVRACAKCLRYSYKLKKKRHMLKFLIRVVLGVTYFVCVGVCLYEMFLPKHLSTRADSGTLYFWLFGAGAVFIIVTCIVIVLPAIDKLIDAAGRFIYWIKNDD